jgi:hypothetical protein
VDVKGGIPVFEVIEAFAVRIGVGVRARHKQAAQTVDRLRRIMPEVINSMWAAHLEYHGSLLSPVTMLLKVTTSPRANKFQKFELLFSAAKPEPVTCGKNPPPQPAARDRHIIRRKQGLQDSRAARKNWSGFPIGFAARRQ